MPGLEEHWYETYGRIALTGEAERFEQGSDALGRWFDVYAFRTGAPEERRVAILFNDISARRTAETALQESETRFRNMADHAPVMMWVTDPEGRCTYLNRAWHEFTGQTREEALDFGWLGAMHPDDKEGAETVFLRANADAESFRLEYRLRRFDGSYRWTIDAAAPRFAEDGTFLGYIGSVIDIDERHEAEDRLRKLTNSLPAFVWFASREGELHYFNDRWYEYTGQTPEEALPNGWVRALHPDDARRTARIRIDAQSRELTYEVEIRFRRADGEYRWYVARAEPIRDAAGAATSWVGTCTDIHDRKLAEQGLRDLADTLEQRVGERTSALAESQRRFRGIFDSALQFMALLTPQGTVLEVNRTALDWSRIGPHDIVGKPFWLSAPMRDNPELQAAIEAGVRRAAGGETVREEHVMRGAGEVRATVDFSLKPVPDEGGRAIWLVAEGRDITELKEAQQALRQAQKMEAMGQLTGGVAHDFNNLLTPIVGSLDMLQRKGLGNEREQRLIAGAAQSAERAKTLVQRLLAFARRQPLQATAVDVSGLVQGMADLIASTSGPQIRVAVDAPAALPPARADVNQLEMALLNLSVNARDAMPQGGTLSITVGEGPAGGDRPADLPEGRYIKLSVSDTGVGMDQATLDRAVEPFFSTKGIGKGTGLGLSMVHGLASQLGGALTIRSRIGVGTDVELWLPIAEHAVSQPDATCVAARQVTAAGTALLVDDEALVRMSTADMLAELGYEVVEAGSGEEALALIRGGLSFDLLVTDHLMPGMNGNDLAQIVRGERPGVKVLLVSGFADTDGVAPDLPRLTKPFRNEELAASLAALG